MKKILFALCTVGMFLSSCDFSTGYKVEGNLTGVEDGKIYLSKVADNKLVKVDSANLKGGKFSFKGEVESPTRYFIQLNGNYRVIPFFVENSKITITADPKNLETLKIVGSATNDIYDSYNELLKRFDAKNKELREKYYKAKAEKNQAVIDSVLKVDEQIQAEVKVVNDKFIKDNNNSVVAAYLVARNIGRMDVKEIEEAYLALGEVAKVSDYGVMVKERLELLKKVAVGQPAPDFTLNTPEDKPLSLSSFKGKVVVIDFWASWCGPCRRENPHMVELYKELHPQGVEFLGVSLDDKKEAWLKAIEDDGLVWNHVSDLKGWKSAAAKKYGINGIPATVVIGRDGKIVANKVFGAELKAAVEKAL